MCIYIYIYIYMLYYSQLAWRGRANLLVMGSPQNVFEYFIDVGKTYD